MAEIDLYNYRGFKVYTPEIPSAPEAPLYDIVFWLSGIEDEDTGLLRCDHYNALDYTDGEWPYYQGIPKDSVTGTPSGMTGIFSIPRSQIDFTNGFSVGYYMYLLSDSWGATVFWYSSSGKYFFIRPNLVGSYFDITYNEANGNDIYQYQVYPRPFLETPHFIQASYDATAGTLKGYVDGVLKWTQEVEEGLTDLVNTFIYHGSGPLASTKINSIILSSDPDVNFYTQMHNGTRLCDLTEYPKLTAPTITTHPASEEVLTGAPFSELSVVYFDGGGTCTLQWYSYSGSAWSEIEGETTSAYTPTTTGTYRVTVTNSKGSVNSNSAVLTETDEIDYMEYSTDELAQEAYVARQGYNEYTKALIHCDGTNESTTLIDEIGHDVTVLYGYLTTADKKFGPSSFNGSFILKSSTDFEFSDDLTIDFWMKYSYTSIQQIMSIAGSTTTYNLVLDFNDTSYDYWLWWNGNGQYYIRGNSATMKDGNWHHHAIVRYSNTYYYYLDGILLGSNSKMASSRVGNSGDTNIFTASSGGAIDEIRITNGQALWTTEFTPPDAPTAPTADKIDVYSENTIKTQGSYALKCVAGETEATLSHTFNSTLNFTNIDFANFNIRSSRTGSNIKLGLHDTGGTTTEITPNITDADTWQNVEWDLSGVADANKNAVDTLTITIVNADAANTFYIDAFEVGEGDGVAEGEILFGTHFDDEDDWNTSQDASLLNDWDQKTADNEGGGTYEAGYIAQHGESSGKCLKQYWDTGTSVAQNCWLIKNSITIPDEFWLGYRFKVDTNWDWGSATSLKIMKLHYDNGTTLDINWCSSHYEMPSPYTPPGGGYSIATDATGKNWFGHWADIDDGAWHTFVWHFKHSTNTLECFIDSVDAALTSETPAFPGSGWDDGSESGYALSFGGNLSGGGGGVDEMYTKYDDVCIGTTRAKVEEYLGL